MKSFKFIFLLSICYSVILSCETTEKIEIKHFETKNISIHDFNLPINKLKDTIITFFDFENQYGNKSLSDIFYYQTDNFEIDKNKTQINLTVETYDANDSLNNSAFAVMSINDIYVHSFGTPWPSKLYFSKDKPLDYRTAFIIRLLKLGENSTRVTIFAEKPMVLNGISSYGAHGAIARETKVVASTIEEYTILKFIAEKLNDKTLSPIKMPIE